MVVCFKMLFKLLLRDAHSFSRASLSENCGLRGTDIFRKIETVVVYYASNILQYAWKKCLRTADCVQRGMISLGCFLVRLNDKKKKTFPFFCNNHKTLSHLELNLKRRLIVVDVRFENWKISIRWYSRISPSLYSDIRSRATFRPSYKGKNIR